MANPERFLDLRTELDRDVVSPLFGRVERAVQPDDSVPEIVLRHRLRRAHERILDALVSRGSVNVPADLRKEVQGLLKRWAEASFHDGLRAVEEFEIRCAREHDLVVAAESGDRERLLEVLEREHRRRVIEQFGQIELRGIQTSHRVLQDLEQVYVPLHLQPQPTKVEGVGGTVITFSTRSRTTAPEILKDHWQILVVGSPGSGKSTLVGYLATKAAAGQLAKEYGWDGNPLPLVLTVRALKRESLTPQSIAEHTGCDVELVNRAFEKQNAFLLVDGLDEAPQEARTRLISALERFVRRYPRIPLIATSRPAGSPGEIEKSLPGLQPFRLADLTRAEVDTFIDKWCLAAEISVRKSSREADREARKAAEDLKQRLSQSYSVQRIAVNPLLVTILCVVHRFLGRMIPEHRVTLYEKCTDALLYEWDRAKFPEGSAIGQLDAPSKRRLLMGIARKIHEEHAAEIEEREVIQHFAQTLPDLGRPAQEARALVEEIRDRSGLLVERRPGFFAFSHLTFQEYFCALDFVRVKNFEELVGHFEESWWQEVIVLAAGVPGAGGGAISRRLISKRNHVAVFLASQCLETETDMPLEVRNKIENSIQKLVPPKNYEEAERLKSLGIVAAPSLAKSLLSHPQNRTFTLRALDRIEFDPTIPAIAQCANDIRESDNGIISEKHGPHKLSVGGYATYIIARRAFESESARIALREACLKVCIEDLKALAAFHADNEDSEPTRILRASLKARSQGISSSKLDGRTA